MSREPIRNRVRNLTRWPFLPHEFTTKVTKDTKKRERKKLFVLFVFFVVKTESKGTTSA